MSDHKFSVLMAVYKQDDPDLFCLALRSVFESTLIPDEVVLVADGPLTEALNKVVAHFNGFSEFRLVRLPQNIGLARALNAGLQEVSNEFVFRADADDINLPNRFLKQLSVLVEGVDVVGSSILEVDGLGKPIAVRVLPCDEDSIRRFARKRNPLNHMTVAFRRQCILDAGGYPSIHLKEDYALWAALLARGARIINVPDVLVRVSAGEAMYARRGGWRYVRSEIQLQRHLMRCGLQSAFGALIYGCMRSSVFLMPVKARGWFYEKILRQKPNELNEHH